jgi:hypothetical protein
MIELERLAAAWHGGEPGGRGDFDLKATFSAQLLAYSNITILGN